MRITNTSHPAIANGEKTCSRRARIKDLPAKSPMITPSGRAARWQQASSNAYYNSLYDDYLQHIIG